MNTSFIVSSPDPQNKGSRRLHFINTHFSDGQAAGPSGSTNGYNVYADYRGRD